jgi:hypothetical protein
MNGRVVWICALSLQLASLASAAEAQQPGIVVIEQVEPLPPAPTPPPEYAPEPPPQYGQQPTPRPHTTPDGTTWVPIPRGYRVVLEPLSTERPAPYAADTERAPRHMAPYLDYDRDLDRAVRRARRWGYVQLASTVLTLVSVAGGMSCSFSSDGYCEGWWASALLGALSFSGAGIVSAFSANRAAGILEDSGVPIGRGTGRFAIALSFIPYVNFGAFIMTTVTLGRVRRARAQRPMPYAPYAPPSAYAR